MKTSTEGLNETSAACHMQRTDQPTLHPLIIADQPANSSKQPETNMADVGSTDAGAK